MEMFIIKKKVVDFLKEHKAAQAELCSTMGIQANALRYHLDGNVPNGSLTKWNALLIIARYYNTPIDQVLDKPFYSSIN